MTIKLTDIPNLLRPGLNAIVQPAKAYVGQYNELFETRSSDKSEEYITEVKPLGLARIRAEGAATMSDDMSQTFTTTAINRYVAIYFGITRNAVMDNLYKSQFPQQAKSLKDSLIITKETLAASVFNNATSSSFLMGDGQPLLSTAHVTAVGTYSNTFAVQVDLSQVALQDAIVAAQGLVDAAGVLRSYVPVKLAVPRNNQFAAKRIMGSQFDPNTANNSVNPLYNRGDYLPQGYCVNQYFTDQNAWYVLTDAPEGFIQFQREEVTTDMNIDFTTQTVLALAQERYSFVVGNPRAIVGSTGST